ncbi:MAG: hypothetical protein JXA33_06080 [Anaerolineae bacterium]|nr:hypothetical protein [Anaerolineae bacterium]
MTTRNKLTFLSFWLALDKGILLALLTGCLAAWPFLSRRGLPMGTDAELHILRIAELGYSLRAGNLYPRWAPDFYHGYGYPIFNYYAPLTYHLGNWITFFQPQYAVQGAKRLFVLTHILGAVGAYLLGRDFGKVMGGLLGAVVFAFSPYILFINPHIRGDLAEVFAVALIPWALWSWERLWQGGERSFFILAVFFPAAILLSHNLTGLTIMVLLIGLSLWHWSVSKITSRFGWALLAGILIMLVTAYFWLPFLVERSAIQLDVTGAGHYDYHNHFILLSQLLSPLQSIDWRAATPDFPMTANPIAIVLALAGVGIALMRKQAKHLLFYVVTSTACLFLTTAASEPIWDTIPGLSFYQFPWRFLGPLAALLVPLVASININNEYIRTFQYLILSSILCLVIGANMPGLYPPPWENTFDRITPADMIALELEGRWRGTTSTNDFVPTSVEMIPEPQESLIASYQLDHIDRVNRLTLPSTATVLVLDDVPWHNRFWITTHEKFTLRLYLFDFPGWKAYMDGAEVPIDVAHPEGFITVRVPAGEHEILISFEDTFPRQLGWFVALVGIAILGWGAWKFTTPTSPLHGQHYTLNSEGLWWSVVPLAILLLYQGFIADSTGWFHHVSPPDSVSSADYTQHADFGGQIELLGFDLSTWQSRTYVYPGKTLEVTLYWQAQRVITETYQSFVHITCMGQVWTQSDHLNPGGFPTNLWPTDRYVGDKHRLSIPPNAPASECQIAVGLYKLQDGRRLPVVWAESGAQTDYLILNQTIGIK